MKIGKYIHELLLENEMVIIPGFGAFVSNYKPAEIDPETNEIKPPSKEVSFNPQIRNNDGLLVGSVAQGEAVSHFDALKLIEKEREDILYKLDKGEAVTLEETGKLSADENSGINFEAFESENLLLDSFGLETVSLEQEETEPVVAPVVVPEEAEKEASEEEVPVAVAETEEEKPAPEPKPEPVVPVSNPVQPKKEEPEKEEEKKRSWLWLLLILAPIAAIGYYLLNQKQEPEQLPAETSENRVLQITEEPAIVPDSALADTVAIQKQDTVGVEKVEGPATESEVIDSPKFYLVGGSFKAEENANKYLVELKERGFEPFLLGKRGNFYIVGIGKFNTEREALIAKRKFTEDNPKSGVWVMEEKANQE